MRGHDLDGAADADDFGELLVSRHQWHAEALGQGDVPGVVRRRVIPKRPHALAMRAERVEVYAHVGQAAHRGGGNASLDVAAANQAAADRRQLGREQVRGMPSGRTGQSVERPLPQWPVEQQGVPDE